MPKAIILDLDSTLLNAYGKQEGIAFNFHYQSNGYNPLVCYDGLTGVLKIFRKLNFSVVEIVALQHPVYINSVKKTVPAM